MKKMQSVHKRYILYLFLILGGLVFFSLCIDDNIDNYIECDIGDTILYENNVKVNIIEGDGKIIVRINFPTGGHSEASYIYINKEDPIFLSKDSLHAPELWIKVESELFLLVLKDSGVVEYDQSTINQEIPTILKIGKNS